MRLKFLGLAATSLLLLACGEETTSSQKTSLSDAEVLAQIASGVSDIGMVGSLSEMATSSLGSIEASPGFEEELVLAGRAADDCSDHFNTTVSFPDEESGETLTMSMSTTLANGSAITCDNLDLSGGFKFSIALSSPSLTMAMVMTTNPLQDGGMRIAGTGSGTFSEGGRMGGFSDLAFSQTIDGEGEITAYAGSMKMSFDGATTDAISFGPEGVVPQTVKVYRNGGVIGTMTFAPDGSVVVKDAAGKIVSEESAPV